MKIRRQSGFSLMEMMVVLLIIAIVLAVTTPMVSRKMARVSDGTGNGCKWSSWDHGIFYGINSDEHVLIGARNTGEPTKGKLQIVSNGMSHIRLLNDDADVMSIYVKNNSAIFSQRDPDGENNDENTKSSVLIGCNIALGDTTHDNLVAIGDRTTAQGSGSTAVGYEAQALNTDSIAIGYRATADKDPGITDITTKGSIAIGSDASANDRLETSTGSNSGAIAIGKGAVADGKLAVAIGTNAKVKESESIQSNQGAAYSVAIGADAKAEGSNQIVLGGSNDATNHNTPQTVIIPGDLRVLGNVYLAVNSDKRVFIRTSKFSDPVKVEDLSFSVDPNYKNGLVVIDPASSQASDRRLKDVGEVFKGGLEELKKLDLYHFTFKNDDKKIPHVGVMAQDLQKIFPDAVITGEDGFLKIRMEDMFYAVINAVKELDAKFTKLAEQVKSNMDLIATLQEKINAQEQEITELKNQNAEFEKRLAKLEKKAGKKEE